MALPEALFNYWRDSYEEATELLAVYRPEGYGLPPTRFRDAFELKPTGEFIIDTPHPADAGIVKQSGTWEAQADNRVLGTVGSIRRVLNIASVSGSELRIWHEHLIAGEFVFSARHVNAAWGHQDYGFVVDTTAGVYGFNRSGEGLDPDIDLTKLFGSGRRFLQALGMDQLLAMHRLVEPASEGKLSDPVHVAMDAGERQFSAYRFDSQTGTYGEVLLAEDGTVSIANQAEEAKQLAAWLRGLWEDIDWSTFLGGS